MIAALLLLTFLVHAPARQDASPGAACEERARLVLKELPSDNDLRRALAQGRRGDCVRRPWMDDLRRLGVKRVSFNVGYLITKKRVSLKIGRAYFHRGYYSSEPSELVRDRRLLREIRDGGLERRLREAVAEHLTAWAAEAQAEVRRTGDTARGEMQASLLDDEALPIIDYVF